jgi:hypothetical protein
MEEMMMEARITTNIARTMCANGLKTIKMIAMITTSIGGSQSTSTNGKMTID